MAHLTALSFHSGDSPLHRLDGRCKLISICLLSIGVARSGFPELTAMNIPIFYFIMTLPIQSLSLIRELRFFFVLIFVVFGVRALVTPGDVVVFTLSLPDLPGMGGLSLTMTKEGVINGMRICWRFVTIMLLGVLFTVTTRPSDLRSTVEWFLKPIPMIPEKQVGMMVSLFIRFFPLILKKGGEVSDAQKARCGDLERNPVKRTLRLGFPILSKVFRSADSLSDAMSARCYSEDRTSMPFQPSGHEIYFFAASLLLSGATLL